MSNDCQSLEQPASDRPEYQTALCSLIEYYKIDFINPPSTRMEAPLVAEASELA